MSGNPPQKSYYGWNSYSPVYLYIKGDRSNPNETGEDHGPWMETQDLIKVQGPQLYICEACQAADCFMCEEIDAPDPRKCYCFRCNYKFGIGGQLEVRPIGWGRPNKFHDALPKAGSKARGRWLARNAPPVPTGEVHLHVIMVKGRADWHPVYRNNKVCKEPGRCVRLKLEDANATLR